MVFSALLSDCMEQVPEKTEGAALHRLAGRLLLVQYLDFVQLRQKFFCFFVDNAGACFLPDSVSSLDK